MGPVERFKRKIKMHPELSDVYERKLAFWEGFAIDMASKSCRILKMFAWCRDPWMCLDYILLTRDKAGHMFSVVFGFNEEHFTSCSPKKVFPTKFQLAWKS